MTRQLSIKYKFLFQLSRVNVEIVEDVLTGCHGEERHGDERGCGGHNGQGVMVRRDMEMTEVVEDAMDRVSW